MNQKIKLFVIHEYMGSNMVIIIETKALFSYSVNTMNNSAYRAILLNCLIEFVEHSHIEYGTIHHIVNSCTMTLPSSGCSKPKGVHCHVMLLRLFLSFCSKKHTKFSLLKTFV